MAARRQSRTLTLLALFICCFGSAAAQNSTDTTDQINGYIEDAQRIITQKAVLGGLCIAVGLFLLIVGQRLWKAALFFTGFFVTALTGYILMVNLEPNTGYEHRGTVLLLGSLACGVVGGGIALCLWKLGLVLLGATAGFLFGMFLLSWKDGGLVDSEKGRIILLAVATGIGIILALVLQKKLLIVGTSMAGAYSVVFGIDCYARTGFTESMQTFLSGPDEVNWTTFEYVFNPRLGATMSMSQEY
ncbi:hypothetical protein PhCBS80983_g03081 [Powellomyces hirtus]|uniref:TM7S3/TM198-like domain-containing protein n=1 Tax=Powellomyces hirtus TaxID=109895 RepID=A0A507E375_9FUNG|nr:hypothetical protein PhCBS80983_g03081 [Powellomyces hirtus]